VLEFSHHLSDGAEFTAPHAADVLADSTLSDTQHAPHAACYMPLQYSELLTSALQFWNEKMYQYPANEVLFAL
jgi:hypothetical protein